MVGILVSFWDGQFSGAMLVSGRVRGTTFEKGGDFGKSKKNRDELKKLHLLVGEFKYFSFIFIPKTGEMIFLRWVVQPPTRFSKLPKCMAYLPTFTRKINQMQVNIPVPWIRPG